jgi:hypothetical protein
MLRRVKAENGIGPTLVATLKLKRVSNWTNRTNAQPGQQTKLSNDFLGYQKRFFHIMLSTGRLGWALYFALFFWP